MLTEFTGTRMRETAEIAMAAGNGRLPAVGHTADQE